MNKHGIMKHNYLFILWGLIIHVFLLWGVLDVNFHSPIIHGLPIVTPPNGAPAKRLLLFVADGLRFKTFIENTPPYLRNVMETQGVWGVSRTRMPTESRPGNIAIAAGLYEDPSAIFKGWKENPVDFDSVFNQSHFTWAWGSPYIIPMFTKGADLKIYGESYPPEWEDFGMTQGAATHLDSWVFDKYSKLLETEGQKIKHQDKIIFFLHLLGCDTTGHSRKPNSKDYAASMKYVDQRIEQIVRETEEIFEDKSTAYVFTADHGMTDWGSHGSGSTDETETPLVVWGAGIKHGLNTSKDIEQADITPLISALIGIPIPVNSEGVLPVHYLDESNQLYRGMYLLNNIKQLLNQIKGNRFIAYGNSNHMDKSINELEEAINRMYELIDEGNIAKGIKEGENIVTLAKEKLYFFRQYQRKRFLIYLSITWISWIVFLFLKITGEKKYSNVNYLNYSVTSLLLNIGYLCLLIILLTEYIVSGYHNWRLLCYGTFTITSLYLALKSFNALMPNLIFKDKVRTYIEITGIISLLLIMFLSLTHRWTLSFGTLIILLIQRIILKHQIHYLLIYSSLALTIFPLLPVVEPHPRIYIVQISVGIMICFIILNKSCASNSYGKAIKIGRLILTGLIYAGIIDGKPWLSWIILITTPIYIWSHSMAAKERLIGVVEGLFCPLALLSASYEPLFFLILAVNLLCWPTAKGGEKNHTNTLRLEDLSQASHVMFYTLMCFFGTGNMASVSSFDPLWTRHFVTVFSPFLMTSLILLKLSIPLIILGCASNIFGSAQMFLASLLLGDCLSLPLIYNVTPEGSWLDIGSAISRFTIAITLPCLLLFLYYFSQLLMRFDIHKLFLAIPKMHIV